MDHYQQSPTWTMVLDNFNLFFIVIFTSEMLMKMFALRHHYFKDAWNLFDFVVVMMSLLSLFFSELIEKYFVSPTLLRVVSLSYNDNSSSVEVVIKKFLGFEAILFVDIERRKCARKYI